MAAPCIGADQAAGPGTAFGAEMQREDQAVRLQRRVQCRQHDAGLDQDRPALPIRQADGRHAREGQDHRIRPLGYGAAAQAGIAALGDHGQAGLAAQPDGGGDLARVGRPGDAQGGRAVAVEPVAPVGDGVLARKPTFRAQEPCQRG